MKTTQKGFTLIELMIVIAIIAILAAIAIPAYQNYTVRAKVTGALSQLDAAKTSIAEFYQTNGHFPTNAASAGLDDLSADVSKYVASVTVGGGDGTLEATTRNTGAAAADTPVVKLSPVEADGSTAVPTDGSYTGTLSWKCSLTSGAAKYVPSNCRGT